ncbi:MAG: UDP-glucose 4-epimerase [Solirubrobacteraceae bacterium]|jgi:UDP-glucose 4-epimerase|nr:UDP-glucose 4-epimerase [Solirubrobacteraceae bacterium]
MQNLTVLVTGGSGFIGSHVVDALITAGIRPRIFDMEPSPHHPAPAVRTCLGQLGDREALEDAMAGCDAVLHLAAVADVSEVALDPAWAEEVNARGTLNVLEAARAAGVGRVLYASTIWVYNGLEGPVVDEDATLGLPNHLYTATKIAGEMYCSSYRELYGLEYTILRFGIPYGPRARPAAVVPQFVRKAVDGEPLTVAGRGDQSRRFIYVEDLAQGCVAALAPHAANRVYNLVGRQDTTILEIAQVVRELIGDVDIVHVESRAGDFRGIEVSPDRARDELGWEARTPFQAGVERYIDWYRAELAEPDLLTE